MQAFTKSLHQGQIQRAAQHFPQTKYAKSIQHYLNLLNYIIKILVCLTERGKYKGKYLCLTSLSLLFVLTTHLCLN